MIKGIGIDIIEVSRVERAVEKNKRFLERVFSEKEIKYIESRNHNKVTIAGLFSAKESISKALGTGIRGFNWTDIEISHDDLGKPLVTLKENAKKIAHASGINSISLSISHIKDQAISISIGQDIVCQENTNNRNDSEIKNILLKRSKNSHKGSFGRVGVVGGSKGMSGAPYLTSSSALRSGSGLVYTIVPDNIANVLEIKSVEAIVKSFKDNGKGFAKESIKDLIKYSNSLDVLALGPGLGMDEASSKLVGKALESLKCPLVLDADGINSISKNLSVLRNRKQVTILTPHLKEFSRLIDLDIETIEKDREKYARDFAKEFGVILVLKGYQTIVCDGQRLYTNHTGNPGMATAGSGDVLTGVITSFLGQGISGFKAAKLGVYIHGLAGDIGKEEKGEQGLIASDIIDKIPLAIKTIV